MAAILKMAVMSVSGLIHLGALKKCKIYTLYNIWAKFGAFARIWTHQLILLPNTPDYLQNFIFSFLSLFFLFFFFTYSFFPLKGVALMK